MRAFLAVFYFLLMLVTAVHAQPYPPSPYLFLNEGTTLSVLQNLPLFTVPNGTAGLSPSQYAKSVTDVRYYGAKCDGVTDDSAAFNAATAAIRAGVVQSGTAAWPIGALGRLKAPQGTCLIKETVNFTNLYGAGFVADLWGTSFLCQTNGTPCVDATGTGQASILGLTVYGSPTNSPNIGLVLARITNNGIGADHNVVEHPTITGYFTLAPYYNRSSETTIVSHGWFYNQQANAYGAIFDGSNYFNFQSAFYQTTYPVNTFTSFNENTCVGCIIEVAGSGTIPLWIGGSARHQFQNSYILGTGATTAVYLYTASSVPNQFLDLDIHAENTSLTSWLKFGGPLATQVIPGLRIRDNNPEQSGPLFTRDNGVTAVTIQDIDLQIGTLAGVSPSWWDSAAAYTVAGNIYNADGTYTAPNTFTGNYCVGATCNVTYSLPSTLNVSSIANPGGVASITLTNAGSYYGGTIPTITIGAPPAGGQQASATVTGMKLYGFGTLATGGNGYAVNDIACLVGGVYTSGGGPLCIKITGESGGAVTTYTYYSPVTSNYTTTPGDGTSSYANTFNDTATGGTGSGTGLTFTGTVWQVGGTSASPGAGYSTAPAVTFSPGYLTAQGTAALASTLTITGGAGQIVLNSSGTVLGTATAPVIDSGAQVDATGVRVTLTGAAYTVPSNIDLVRFIQNGTIAANTITLPTAFGDGQPIQFVSYAGTVTALTFSPAVNGWSNGATLAANTGVRIRWDATAAAWYREQ